MYHVIEKAEIPLLGEVFGFFTVRRSLKYCLGGGKTTKGRV
jgi:hypothetical protein